MHAGALDHSFGENGSAMASVPAPQAVFDSWALTVQDDGRIVVGGMDDPVWDGDPGAHFALAWFLADGTPDPSFGSDGMVVMTIAPGERDSEVRAVIPAPGGGVIACGSVDGLQGPGTLVLARFDASGRLDPGFGSGGVVRGAAGLCDGMARGPGATVVVGGSLEHAAQTPTFLAARYLADGSPDLILGGTELVPPSNRRFAAARYLPDGSLQARRATLRVVLASLRRTLATRKARRLLGRGGLTIEVTLPTGSRLALALPGLGASHATVARGTASARRGATRLRLRTTRTGMHVLQASGRLRVGARARLLSSTGPDVLASTKVTCRRRHADSDHCAPAAVQPPMSSVRLVGVPRTGCCSIAGE